jgi:serine O-acetyltransferase
VQKHLGQKIGCEIGWANIGSGLVLSHPYGITVNSGAVIGNDCTLFKGCTIGSVRSGSIAGVPKLGDRVTVCCNAMICGNVTIGNDVLIAAGAYVNFDVPDNSVVIGNPGVIHHKENPSKDYL